MPDTPSWHSVWQLKRNCSLTPRQLGLAFAAMAVVSLAVAGALWVMGAPYVLPFACLELLALAAAMLVYTRHATDQDFIGLTPQLLRVELHRAGQVSRWDFSSHWVRIEPQGANGSLVRLSGQGVSVDVGRFVRADLRQQLARELRWALRQLQGSAAHPHDVRFQLNPP